MTARAKFGLFATLLLGCACCLSAQTAAPAASVVMDRVVATVNNQAILVSDIDEEIRIAVLDPSRGETGILLPAQALDQLISRALILQQMRREDFESAVPTGEEVDARIKEMRTELPVCAGRCATDSGWAEFLTAHSLTPERVAVYVRNRIEILRFIEERFRQGIRVPQEDIESYYRKTLLPQFAPGAEIPPLEKVAQRIEEILLQQRVNALFGDWLRDLRRQGEVEVLDPALENADKPAAGKGGSL